MLVTNSKIDRPSYKFSKYFRYKRAVISRTRSRPRPINLKVPCITIIVSIIEFLNTQEYSKCKMQEVDRRIFTETLTTSCGVAGSHASMSFLFLWLTEFASLPPKQRYFYWMFLSKKGLGTRTGAFSRGRNGTRLRQQVQHSERNCDLIDGQNGPRTYWTI